MAPKIAGIQPSIIKPLTNADTIKSIEALIIKVKRPNVTKVKGKAIKDIMGRIKVLTTPKSIAANIADVKSATLNPGTMYAVTINAKAFNSRDIIMYKTNHLLNLLFNQRS